MPDEWIRQWGDPVLREVAAPIGRIDEVSRRQIARMKVRLEEADGAGLAAIQVGFLRRVFAYRLRREDEVEVLVNPRIVTRSSERALFFEGCLSFQAVTVAVSRAVMVRVEALDLVGRSLAVLLGDERPSSSQAA